MPGYSALAMSSDEMRPDHGASMKLTDKREPGYGAIRMWADKTMAGYGALMILTDKGMPDCQAIAIWTYRQEDAGFPYNSVSGNKSWSRRGSD